jgi:hypothetical protein
MVQSFLSLLDLTVQYYDLCCQLHTTIRLSPAASDFRASSTLGLKGMQSSLDKQTNLRCTSS